MITFIPPTGIVTDKLVIPGTSGHVLQVTCGIKDEWEPSTEELEDIADLLTRAVESLCPDEKIAILVTRRGVQITTDADVSEP